MGLVLPYYLQQILSDTLEFQIFDDFRVADAIVSAEASQTIDGNLIVTGTLSGTGGVNIGIQSAGQNVTTGVITALNFIGVVIHFVYDTVAKTVDISIAGGGGGGGLGTAINYSDDATASPFSYIDREATVTENLMLDTTKQVSLNQLLFLSLQILIFYLVWLLQLAQVRLWLLMYFKSEISDVKFKSN